MTNTSEANRDIANAGQAVTDPLEDLHVWFMREVFPLEAALTQFLSSNWRNRSDVADLLQDIYVQVFRAAEKERPKSVKPFVFMTARNLLIDRVRHDKIIPLEAAEDLEALEIAADAPGPDAQLAARDELKRVQTALDQLPERAREAFVLCHVEGLSQREIAARMKVTEKTVSWHLRQGVEALADMLYGEMSTRRGK